MSVRIVLIGAGSAQFGFDMLGDFFQSPALKGCHIVLHDIDPEALARTATAGQAFVAEHGIEAVVAAVKPRNQITLRNQVVSSITKSWNTAVNIK